MKSSSYALSSDNGNVEIRSKGIAFVMLVRYFKYLIEELYYLFSLNKRAMI